MDSAQSLQALLDQLAPLRPDLLGRLLLASFLGGVIGWERESSGKPAGLRTNLLICVGAALLGDVSIHFSSLTPSGLVRADPARIAAQIVSGIGFLGAGTIIQSRGSVTGLTTAATLWVVAAIGLAVGGGMYIAALGTTLLVLLALVPMGAVEKWMEDRHTTQLVQVVATFGPGLVEEVEGAFQAVGVEAEAEQVTREAGEDTATLILHVTGSPEAIREGRRRLIERDGVRKVARLTLP